MFGAFRFVLSVMVVVTHMFYPYWFGHYAVFGFFILSGYLMTYVTNKVYFLNTSGVSRFLVNRFLRIYPIYYVVVFFSIIVLYFIPDAHVFNPSLTIPVNSQEWIFNIFIFGMESDSSSRIVPPVWALANELIYYILICLILGRKSYIAIAWLLVSVVWVLYSIYVGDSFHNRYFSVVAASLPFSIGAVFYHYKKYLVRVFENVSWYSLILFTLYVLVSPISVLFLNKSDFLYGLIDPHGLVMYLNVILMLIWIGKLTDLKPINPTVASFDKFLGDLSYPLYLVHWVVGLVLANYVFESLNRGSFLLMITCLFFSIFVSILLVLTIERPLEIIRLKLRRV